MTLKQMCEDIVARIKERTGKVIDPEAFFNAGYRGSLHHVWEAYWLLFPESLPADVADPQDGAMRYHDNQIEVFMGADWIRYAEPKTPNDLTAT